VSQLGGRTFRGALQATRRDLRPLADASAEKHEVALANALERVLREDPYDYPSILTLAGALLITLCARDRGSSELYAPLLFPEQYFASHPINLISLRHHATHTWPDLSIAEWFGWLASRWGAEAHMRVALRKLRQQGRDTFHIMPTDLGLKVLAETAPTFTTPRYDTTTQILQDLGVTARSSDGGTTTLTPLGQSLWR
jgi:hypothetical protein